MSDATRSNEFSNAPIVAKYGPAEALRRAPVSRRTASIRRLRAEAAKHGATLHEHNTPKEYTAQAPAGYVWAGSGVHEVIAHRWNRDDTPATIRAALLEDMRGGIEKCPDADCDWCNT